jgi:hypothetical protein
MGSHVLQRAPGIHELAEKWEVMYFIAVLGYELAEIRVVMYFIAVLGYNS